MYNRNDWTKAISKLTRLTVEGNIIWSIADDYDPPYVDSVDECYVGNMKDEKLYVVYEGRERNYTDEESFYYSTVIGLDIWTTSFADELGNRIASSPRLPALSDLLEAVRGRIAVDGNALGSLLNDE